MNTKLNNFQLGNKGFRVLSLYFEAEPCAKEAILPFFSRYAPLDAYNHFFALLQMFQGCNNSTYNEAHRVCYRYARIMHGLYLNVFQAGAAEKSIPDFIAELVDQVGDDLHGLKGLMNLFSDHYWQDSHTGKSPVPMLMDLISALGHYNDLRNGVRDSIWAPTKRA